MRTLRWGDGTKWGDPNAYWGNPSYVLEPGDPGYVDPNPPPPATQTNTKKTKPMKRQPFLPGAEADMQTWLNNLVDKLQDPTKGYATKYGILAATLTALDNGRKWVNAVMSALTAVRTASQNLTAFKNQLFTGSGAITPPVAPVITFPNPATVALAAGVFTLASATGQQIKAAVNYSVPDGEDMGLEGAVVTPPPAGGTAPDLSKSRLTTGGHVEIVWIKGRFTAIKLMVDRGDGHGEVFLAIDTVPNYTDTVLPAAGATAIYTYRAIYMMGDAEFGQWSQAFEITVRG